MLRFTTTPILKGQMIISVNAWLRDHPVTATVIIGTGINIASFFLAPVIAPAAETFWKFLAVRPQKLHDWWLEARIAALESKAHQIRRLSQDTHYLVFHSLLCVLFCLVWILGFIIAIGMLNLVGTMAVAAAPYKVSKAQLVPLLACAVGSFAFGGVMYLVAFSRIVTVANAVLRPVSRLKKLEDRIQATQKKLGRSATRDQR